jgi:hypothetical protein
MKPRTEEEIPRRVAETITWDSEPEARRRLLNSAWCGRCNKIGLRTKGDAHNYIGLLLAKPHTPRVHESTLKPYRCPHGNGWHVGRDIKTVELLRKKKS